MLRSQTLRVLQTQKHIPVAHLYFLLIKRRCRRYDVLVVDNRTELVREVGTKRQSAHRTRAQTDIKLVDAAISRHACRLRRLHRSVVGFKIVAKRVSHRGVRHQADARTHIFRYRELQRKVVQASTESFSAVALLARLQLRKVKTDVPMQRQRVGCGIRCRVHHVDLTAVGHSHAHAAHIALRAGCIVAEQSVTIS